MRALSLLLPVVLFMANILPSAGHTITYTALEQIQIFTFPSGVSSISLTVAGSQGGTDGSTAGGKGAVIEATMAVSQSIVYNIYVGKQNGWFRGGGVPSGSYGGAVGGGATDIRLANAVFADRIITAAGM